MPSKARGRKGKIGKHGASIAAYYASYRWEINKARRIHRHVRHYSANDTVAYSRLRELLKIIPAHLSGSVV
jgi:hypothetical protein